MDAATLQAVISDHPITRETDASFLYEFQKALLLSLLEDGTLTEAQCRYAEEKLRMQFP